MLAFTACDNNKETPEPENVAYHGALKVTSNTDGLVTFEKQGVIFELTKDSGQFSLTMNDVKFSNSDREPVKTIVIKNLTSSVSDDVITLHSAANPIIPEIGGTPYPEFAISKFECTLSGYIISVSFVCVNTKLHLDHKATFRGSITL